MPAGGNAEGKRSGYMDMEMGAETAAAMVEASAERGSRAGGMEGGTECERGVFRAKRKRERVSATPIERHQEVAEAMSRGAEPLGGAAARRRKRAGRGYMPLRQRTLPPRPKQNHTLRATLPTRFYATA